MELELLAHTSSNVVQDVDCRVVEEVFADLVVHDAVGAEDVAGSALNRDLCVRDEVWEADDIGAVLVLGELAQVADDIAGGVGDNLVGPDGTATGAVGEDVDGLRADAIFLVQTLDAEEEGVLWVNELCAVADRDGPGGFGEDVLGGRVDERDVGAVAVHAQAAVLRDGGEEGGRGEFWWQGLAAFGIDEVGGDVVWCKVSVARPRVSAVRYCLSSVLFPLVSVLFALALSSS